MFHLRRPSVERVARVLAAQAHEAPDYPGVGTVLSARPPAGYLPLHHRVPLGVGCWDAARAAVDRWAMIPDWVEAHGTTALDATAAVVIRSFGLWTINCARIVLRVDTPERYGFAYGTLPHHVERGEELFCVEREGDAVFYRITSFSRPRHPLVWLGAPIARMLQRRFLRDSGHAMQRLVSHP